MRRAMSLWLPTWATDLARRRLGPSPAARGRPVRGSDTVILLTQQANQREVVARRCAAAAALGVSVGLDLSHARALIPGGARLHVAAHQPERDAEALRRFARWMLRFSPTVALDPPDGLLLDATGLERHYAGRGEAGLMQTVGAAVSRQGFSVRIAVAATYGVARAVARFGREALTRVPPGCERDVFAALPAQALCDDGATQAAFDELALTRVGQILDLPRAALAAQFGDALLRRIDQALGLAVEIVEPVKLAAPPRAEIVFDGASDRWETLEAAAGETLDALLALLASRGLAPQQLDLSIQRRAGRPREMHTVRLCHASHARRHLWAMLRAVLERIDATTGIEGVSLAASAVQPIDARQVSLGISDPHPNDSEHPAAWGELLDTLMSSLDPANVVRFEPVESHLPERAFRAVAAAGDSIAAATIAHTDRPTRLFDPPIPATVALRIPDGPLLHVAWSGRRRGVVACRGPERIAAEWWQGPPPDDECALPAERDYFAVQTDDGAWLWLFRNAESGRWFVHGDWA